MELPIKMSGNLSVTFGNGEHGAPQQDASDTPTNHRGDPLFRRRHSHRIGSTPCIYHTAGSASSDSDHWSSPPLSILDFCPAPADRGGRGCDRNFATSAV